MYSKFESPKLYLENSELLTGVYDHIIAHLHSSMKLNSDFNLSYDEKNIKSIEFAV